MRTLTLTHTDAMNLTRALRTQHDGASTAKALVLARSICNQSLADGLIERDPFARLRLNEPKSRRKQERATWPSVRLAVGEPAKGAPAGPSKTAVQTALGAGTGLRVGEIAGLELAGIDWLRKR